MKPLLALLLLLSQLLIAEPRTLDSVTYRTQGGNTIALIKLSDESIWKWIPDTYSENMLRKWTPGDPIVIRTINHPGFQLENLNTPHYAPIVSLTFNSYLLFPEIAQFDPENDLIELSDGSQWELAFDFNKRALYYWAVGDRIVPASGRHGCCELINLDIPYENPKQIERSIQAEPCKVFCSPNSELEGELPEEHKEKSNFLEGKTT